MIPADVANRLQIAADTALRPVAPEQELTDKLSGLVAGQKVMAVIQAMLPNGTYRAVINQRSITLALPFAAKSGDSLELQVTESNGKLALAVVSGQGDDGLEAAANSSARASLSRTGQLISTLYSGAREGGGETAAVPLNANQPIGTTPVSAQDLLPQLKQAITQSGMFYEAHQAEWVEGRLAKSALLQEPQGKLSLPQAFSNPAPQDPGSAVVAQVISGAAPDELAGQTPRTATASAVAQATNGAAPDELAEQMPRAATAGAVAQTPDGAAQDEPAGQTPRAATGDTPNTQATVGKVANDDTPVAPRLATDSAQTVEASKTGAAQSSGQIVAPQAQALVQQQLEALATQTFSWQGQVWPGQEMRWEIDEDNGRNAQEGDETAPRWNTRLHLTLPVLGEIDAQIRLQGNQITLSMAADNAETRDTMRAATLALRSQLDQAGIVLASMGVADLAGEESDEQAPR